MLDYIGAVFRFFFDQVGALWALYTGGTFIASFFALWVLDRMFHIFDVLKR